ncbi:uncharacterized protein DFL_004383 [Arthrobotrys flagrans]|uniref:Altered inheritance of mitochondria protein 6 n=1 Tax=Arthrobotrys flagrans TaxID=97331 RepID=A0A437A4P8_ARTFL|nr:hypothetical protein DFL_004383 [Arthrobotrys flagrans]
MVSATLFIQLLVAGAASAQWSDPSYIQAAADNWAEQNPKLSKYPNDFTRDIWIKEIHSHNDYTRKAPFYEALSVGAMSVEADVWVKDGQLLVGHDEISLTRERTLRSLYIDPIMDTLRKMNPDTEFSKGTKCGLFGMWCPQTFHLAVDFKSPAEEVLPLLLKDLAPLREGGFLTEYNGEEKIERAITVSVGGTAVYENVIAGQKLPRNHFVVAPILEIGTLDEQRHPDGSFVYDNTTSLFAQAHFNAAVGLPFEYVWGEVTAEHTARLKELVQNARARGMGSTFWGSPNWPVGARNSAWKALVEAGVSLIYADDLQAAAKALWQ